MSDVRDLLSKTFKVQNDQYVFSEAEMYTFVNQLRDNITDDLLTWYNASKKCETKDDPYWKGYQHAIDDAVECIFDQMKCI